MTSSTAAEADIESALLAALLEQHAKREKEIDKKLEQVVEKLKAQGLVVVDDVPHDDSITASSLYVT
jgi:uncharacterized membrane protein